MNNIKKARENAGYSQKQVALTLHVSAPTVSDWEAGKINPSALNLKALGKLFKVSTDYLLGQTDDSLYIEPNSNFIWSNEPISILVSQYHVSDDVMSSITGADIKTINNWILGIEKPSEKEYSVLSNFFEISIDDLKSGRLPLFPKESVQLRVLELTDIRFAAYGKDGDFTIDELKKIKEYAELVRRARGEQLPEDVIQE